MNGLLIVDKPAGMTSHDVVAMVRRATGERSRGAPWHAGPDGDGSAAAAAGKVHAAGAVLSAADKQYTGAIRFGFATDTFDAEGNADGRAGAR